MSGKLLMKIVTPLMIASTLLVVAGCNRSSTSTQQSSEDLNAQPPRVQTESTNRLTPTSRDTNGANQFYRSDTNKTNGTATSAPDNTRINERDRSQDSPTASDQGGSESDREMTRSIRKEVNAKDDLST